MVHSASFRLCRDRVLSKENFNKAGSGLATAEELKSFNNCLVKSFKAQLLMTQIPN